MPSSQPRCRPHGPDGPAQVEGAAHKAVTPPPRSPVPVRGHVARSADVRTAATRSAQVGSYGDATAVHVPREPTVHREACEAEPRCLGRSSAGLACSAPATRRATSIPNAVAPASSWAVGWAAASRRPRRRRNSTWPAPSALNTPTSRPHTPARLRRTFEAEEPVDGRSLEGRRIESTARDGGVADQLFWYDRDAGLVMRALDDAGADVAFSEHVRGPVDPAQFEVPWLRPSATVPWRYPGAPMLANASRTLPERLTSYASAQRIVNAWVEPYGVRGRFSEEDLEGERR